MADETGTDIRLLYFAWVREKIGHGSESIALPSNVTTVRDLVRWLKTRGANYEAAFAKDDLVRAAIDQRHVKPETPIGEAREIAFFPPVTGG